MEPFQYPEFAHVRRHSPMGYSDYASYLPWLRDEFTFRCVYCLIRERWYLAPMNIDHFLPVSHRPDLANRYDNLLYACSRCNGAKAAHHLPDPTVVLLRGAVRAQRDGLLEATTAEARRLIRILGLNTRPYRELRLVWLGILGLAKQYDPALFARLMGYPADLPDLSALKPPDGNTRPEGIAQSYHARRERGELADTY